MLGGWPPCVCIWWECDLTPVGGIQGMYAESVPCKFQGLGPCVFCSLSLAPACNFERSVARLLNPNSLRSTRKFPGSDRAVDWSRLSGLCSFEGLSVDVLMLNTQHT